MGHGSVQACEGLIDVANPRPYPSHPIHQSVVELPPHAFNVVRPKRSLQLLEILLTTMTEEEEGVLVRDFLEFGNLLISFAPSKEVSSCRHRAHEGPEQLHPPSRISSRLTH